MKKISVAFVFMLLLPIANSFAADEAYYIELGGDVSEDAAAEQWKTLSTTYKTQLGSLQFFPKTVIEGGKPSSVRIQAGPIATKEKAEKTCHRLFAHKVSCFVIEGLENAPPASVVSLPEKVKEQSTTQADLPWLRKKPPEQDVVEVQPAREEHSMWSWLTGKKKLETENAPIVIEDLQPHTPAPVKPVAAPVEEKEANVEVTEAVHVPLSDGNGTVPASQPITIRQIDPAKATTIASNDTGKSGWLIVPGFADDNSALSAWQSIRSAVPQKAAGLRVRVVQPLAHSNTKTSLNIGPFATRADAEAFCQNGVQAADSKLHCHFTDKESTAIEEALVPRAKPAFDPAKPSKQYWAQIITAPSQSEALEQWQELKTGNADLLKDVRSSISPSQTRKNAYVVRIGPLADNNDALSLCSTLQERGIHCSVMLFSGM